MESIQPLLKENGVSLDLFIEETFCWHVKQYVQQELLPYRADWVGFVHNPPGIPEWHEYDSSPQSIFATSEWIDSQTTCRGLFTFSEEMRRWMASRVQVPVARLIHPSETPEKVFSFNGFLERPRIVQVGAWLRRLSSIALLPVERLRKVCLIPRQDGARFLEALLERERTNDPAAKLADWSNVEVIDYLGPVGFDELLGQSVVFLDLYDSVVNNTVIECIVRGTPLLCNRLRALEELLGGDYPLFFSDLPEAARKADDFELIAKAAGHLQAIPKDQFTGQHFARSIAASEIYRSLP